MGNPCPSNQWSLMEPEPVINYFLDKNISEDPKTSIFGCPASRAFFKNLFVFRSNIDDKCVWPEGYLSSIVDKKMGELDNFGNKMQIMQVRKTAIEGYIDLVCSIDFVMFADKPLKIRLSSPNYPPSAPSKGAMFTSGEYDFGRWYRPVMLDWFVPVESTEFAINKGDGLFYAQAMTDEKVVFQKFIMNDNIKEITQSFLMSRRAEGERLTLEERYEIAEGKKIQQNILAAIKQSLIN